MLEVGDKMIAFLLFALASEALAEAPINLAWEAPHDCPSTAAIIDRMGAILPERSTGGFALSVLASAWKTEEGLWRPDVQIEAPTGSGHRQLAGESCEAVVEALALFVSLVADLPGSDNSEQPRRPVSPAEHPTEEPAEQETEQDRIDAEQLRYAVRAIATSDFGTMPYPIPGPCIAAGVELYGLRLEGYFGYWFDQRHQSRVAPNAGGVFSLAAAGLRAQYRLITDLPELSISVGGEMDWMTGRGFGVPNAQTKTVSWPALGIGVPVAWRVNDTFVLWVQPELLLSRAQPAFIIENLGRIHRPRPITFRVGAGVEMRF